MLNKRNAGMAFAFVTVLADMLALGIIIPVWPKLIMGFEGGSFANASLIGGTFATIFAVIQFFASPVLGTLSDRVGRRPILLLSNFGTCINYCILALAPNIGWLFVGHILSGFTTSSMTVVSAYIADVTPEEKRAGGYGMLSAAFGIGFVVGPAVGGWLGGFDPRLPFWVAGALSLANFAYGLLIVPESLARENRNEFSWKRANPFGAIKLLRRHRELSGLSTVNAIEYVAHEALPQLFVYYTLYAYHWTMSLVGYSLAAVGVLTIVISMMTQRVVDRIGERRAVAFGLVLGGIGFMLYSGNQVVFYVALIVNMFWMIAGSASQSIMTRRVGRNEQGELQGALNLLRSFGMLVGPLFFTSIFAFSISDQHTWKAPAAAWIVGGLLLLIAAAVAWRVTTPQDDVSDPVDTLHEVQTAVPAEA